MDWYKPEFENNRRISSAICCLVSCPLILKIIDIFLKTLLTTILPSMEYSVILGEKTKKIDGFLKDYCRSEYSHDLS